jgi:hypothetical protein
MVGNGHQPYNERPTPSKRIRAVLDPSSPNPTRASEKMDEKSQQQSQSDAPSGGFMQDTPPRADVDEILRRKRKAREYKVSTSAQVSLICSR